ncbi:exonuclease domain-containing protein [Membranicola marinus]|uniref:Exonuclease domain-containing protein n=1 Tax=Membranihabitans marinus TaxID=1227546 RepID=A0A953HM41_9BACT|nr:3'-5' exonuclease [Membranihabitans marinus]MBY5957023.1 exonuclease domain-containing protein [Membranihabitans marinus]
MKFILFDLEATCWDGYHSNAIQEIIEIGALAINRYGEHMDEFDELVRPVINPRLSLYCQNLTGIQQQEVNAALDFETVYDDFETWANADVDTWFVSWGTFDPDLLREECERHLHADSLIGNYLDLRSAYTSMKDIPSRTGLVKALEYEEIDFEGTPHRALPDVLNMSDLFIRYLDSWDFS